MIGYTCFKIILILSIMQMDKERLNDIISVPHRLAVR